MSENPDFQVQDHQRRLFDYSLLISEEEIPTASYSLRLKDFSDENKPDKVEPWEYPQPVTRNNFVPYTVKVFGFSQGMPLIHRMYMNLIQRRTGFDGYAANTVFRAAGGWNTLSEEERAHFQEAFASVMRHGAQNRYDQKSRYKSFGSELLENLPYKRMPPGIVDNTIYEKPANYDLPDEQILAYLRQLRASEKREKSLQIDY